jgi:aspartyl-tRNA(Asn)/glutamyl-tRNA(Gln) amidotransferase subunit C
MLKIGMGAVMVRPAASRKFRLIKDFRPSMSLDTATIRRIAALARLRLEEHEVAQAQTEINGILGWIEQLQAVDTDGVEPMAGGSATALVSAPLRADAVTDGGQADAVLANAPDRQGQYFGVPKVVE